MASRLEKSIGLRGLSWSSLKHNPSLIPLFAFVGIGVTGSVAYGLRVLIKGPEIVINKKNKEPFNAYANKHYKFYQAGKEPLGNPAPVF